MNISVIIPVYNAGKYVRIAVESALDQEEVKEIILIEDGSPDNSLEVCRKLESKYDTVKLFQHQNGENRGAGETRNVGLKNATQEYIAFLDADDFYLQNRFKKTKEVFVRDESVDGVYEAIGVHFEDKKAEEQWKERSGKKMTTVTKEVAANSLFPFLVLAGKGHFSLDGLTIKRRIVDEELGFFEKQLRISQDTHFCLKLSLLKKLSPGKIDKPIAKRRVHSENRITQVDKNKMISYQAMLWKLLNDWSFGKNVRYSHKYLIHFMEYYYKNLRKNVEKKRDIIANHYYFPFLFLFSFRHPIKGCTVFLLTSKYLLKRFF